MRVFLLVFCTVILGGIVDYFESKYDVSYGKNRNLRNWREWFWSLLSGSAIVLPFNIGMWRLSSNPLSVIDMLWIMSVVTMSNIFGKFLRIRYL